MTTATPTHSGLSPTASNSSISGSSRACVKAADSSGSDTFPAGLRVLVVDDDPICLLILDRMLRHCQYQVTSCGRATEALAMLRKNRDSFDVILSDVCMPDMDGFKLLELVGLEMDLPVIMMSANGETSAVMKGIKHGACDYLLKPVRMEELRNIWQHVVRKKWKSSGQTTSHEVDKARQVLDDGEHASSANEGQDGTWRQSKKRKDMKEEEDEVDLDNDDPSSTKKPRVVWSVELHQQFVNAVNQLGIDKAVPKRILELMSVQGLTRENVASHLQKYRLYLKRISSVAHQAGGGLNSPFPVGTDGSFGSVSAAGLAGLNDLRTLAGPSSSALTSSLQNGALAGRLNPTNLGMSNLDPSMLIRLAALQGAGHGGLTRPPTMNVQGAFQDMNQLQASQLGAFAGSLDKGPGLSVLQQQQLAAMARFGDLGQLPGVGNNAPLINSNSNVLLMQTLQQQQQAGGHLTTSRGSLSLPTNAGLGGQQGLAVDIDPWATTTISGPNSSSLRLLSLPNSATLLNPLSRAAEVDGRSVQISSAGNSVTLLNPLGRAAEVDGRSVQIPNAGNVGVSSPSISSGVDDLAGGVRVKDVGASVLATNEGLRQSYASKFALFSGLKQEQEPYPPGQRTPGLWQGLDMSQEQGQFNDRQIQCPSYNQAFSGGQSLMLGIGQDQSQAFTPRFSGNAIDMAQFKALQMKGSQGDNVRAAEASLRIKEEGPLWLQEPLSDELLTIVLKQQQEGLGLAESELGGSDAYAMDNMYVK